MKHWYSSYHWLSYLLLPLSYVYRFFMFIRYQFYRWGLKKQHSFSVPVVVVGNLTVGGTGKTPLVVALTDKLKEQGYRPGIVSRGYGGKSSHYPLRVTPDSDPEMTGDEPVLLAQQTGCPVIVDPNRVSAVQHLLSEFDCNIVLSDDGLQHYALQRDIEVLVVDGERFFGNGFCLPAGPLREPIKRLEKVNFIIANGRNNSLPFQMEITSGRIQNLINSQLFLKSTLEPVHAVAGIGNPDRFFKLLRYLGFSIIEHAFPDHYKFSQRDIDFGEESIVIMTEKDAVKCRNFADYRHWYLPIKASLSNEFVEQFLSSLKTVLIFQCDNNPVR